MKHLVRVSIFVEVDTDHTDYIGPMDIEGILDDCRNSFAASDLYEASEDGMTVTSFQVELVE